MYQTTIYTDHQGQRYPAVFLTWDQVEAVLGRGHDGTAEDDQELVEALIGAGAPDWVEEAQGWTDEQGWGLYRPQPLYRLNDDWPLFEPHYMAALEQAGATHEEIEALLDGAWQAVEACHDVEALAAAELRLLREKKEEED